MVEDILVRFDCFADPKPLKGGLGVDCKALKPRSQSGRARGGCEGCSFYKPKSVNDAELLRYNGTTDPVEICDTYSRMQGYKFLCKLMRMESGTGETEVDSDRKITGVQ